MEVSYVDCLSHLESPFMFLIEYVCIFMIWIGPNKKKKRRVVQSLSHNDAREDVDSKVYIHSVEASCQKSLNENVKSAYILGTVIMFCMASMIYFFKY